MPKGSQENHLFRRGALPLSWTIRMKVALKCRHRQQPLASTYSSSDFLLGKRNSSISRNIWSLFPPNLLTQAIVLLSGATSTPRDPGISWSSHVNCIPNDQECVTTINDIYTWLASTFVRWFVLANIIPNPYGVRKWIVYFLNPCYWIGRGGSKARAPWQRAGSAAATAAVILFHFSNTAPDDEDVLQEETIKSQSKEGVVNPDVVVQIRGLTKVYRGTTKLGCCKCKGTPVYHALKVCPVSL